jgi:hypothetical protein
MGSRPHLTRTYHALWPGLCDTLRSIRDRAGESAEIAQARGYEGRICSFAAWYPAGWGGWCRNFRHYDLRLYAWEPGLLEANRVKLPESPKLTPEQLKDIYPEDFFPAGRAKVIVELIAWRGR